MHPNKVFHWTDTEAMRGFVAARGFAHLFVGTIEGPVVAHVPLTAADGGHFRFHVARYNRIAPYLDGAAVLASILGVDGYISPDWYADASDQVPTWNYVAVEIEGTAHLLSEADLVEQIDALSHRYETALAPKPEWTRDKVGDAKLRAMYGAIQCYELRVSRMQGTRKLSQNKSPADREGVITALGDHPLAVAMEQ